MWSCVRDSCPEAVECPCLLRNLPRRRGWSLLLHAMTIMGPWRMYRDRTDEIQSRTSVVSNLHQRNPRRVVCIGHSETSEICHVWKEARNSITLDRLLSPRHPVTVGATGHFGTKFKPNHRWSCLVGIVPGPKCPDISSIRCRSAIITAIHRNRSSEFRHLFGAIDTAFDFPAFKIGLIHNLKKKLIWRA